MNKEKLKQYYRQTKILRNVKPKKNGCLEWEGYLNEWGYGRVRYNGKKMLVHRAVYQFFFGDIPKGLLVLHRCDNPACCNIEHLFLGTHKDNVADCIKKGRHKGHLNSPFKKGHKYGGRPKKR